MALAIILSGCSTTKRLGPDDILYTGVKKIDIAHPTSNSNPRPDLPKMSRPLSTSSPTTP